MVNNVGHNINDKTNTKSIVDNIVGAQYIFQPTLYYIGSIHYELQYFYWIGNNVHSKNFQPIEIPFTSILHGHI